MELTFRQVMSTVSSMAGEWGTIEAPIFPEGRKDVCLVKHVAKEEAFYIMSVDEIGLVQCQLVRTGESLSIKKFIVVGSQLHLEFN